jgi:TPR repeat protein
LVDLQLQLMPPDQNLYGAKPKAPDWSVANPHHWLPAAERGDPEAMLQLALIYDRADDLPRAETWYRKAADAGAPAAKERLDAIERRRHHR